MIASLNYSVLWFRALMEDHEPDTSWKSLTSGQGDLIMAPPSQGGAPYLDYRVVNADMIVIARFGDKYIAGTPDVYKYADENVVDFNTLGFSNAWWTADDVALLKDANDLRILSTDDDELRYNPPTVELGTWHVFSESPWQEEQQRLLFSGDYHQARDFMSGAHAGANDVAGDAKFFMADAKDGERNVVTPEDLRAGEQR